MNKSGKNLSVADNQQETLKLPPKVNFDTMDHALQIVQANALNARLRSGEASTYEQTIAPCIALKFWYRNNIQA